MPYITTRQIKTDVLRRGGEAASSEDFGAAVIDYINRSYNTLAAGASEFLPEYVEDWWWLRGTDVITLEPATTGLVSLTQDSDNITFSAAPAPTSVVGFRIKIEGYGEQFEIAEHTAGATAAVLDSPYTGLTNAVAKYTLMKVHYTLSDQVASLISPMVGFKGNTNIIGLSPERMDNLYPLPDLSTGISTAFALEDSRTVRFSHGGLTDGSSMRVEYRYRKLVDELTDSDDSIPVIPIQWRHLLADMALTYLYLELNDDRSNATALSARTGLAAMLKENRRQITKMGGEIGHISTRGKFFFDGPFGSRSFKTGSDSSGSPGGLTAADIGSLVQAWSANLDGWSIHDPVDFSTTSQMNVAIAVALAAGIATLGVTVINYVIDGGGVALVSGDKGDLVIGFDCTIDSAIALANEVGDIEIDVWKTSYDDFPPDVGDSIVGAAPITITAADKSKDNALTGWDKAITAGDTLTFNVNSATDIKRVTIALIVSRP